jgi:hypothetical protein
LSIVEYRGIIVDIRGRSFYALTRQGRKQFDRGLKIWERLSSAVQLLIENA